MFKKIQKTACALAILAAIASSVMAANSVDVKVIGTVTPAACTPTLSGGGVVDYGTIKASALNKDNYTTLATKSLDLTIACDAPAKIALHPINNRPGTVAGSTEGPYNTGKNPRWLLGITPGAAAVVGLGMDGDNKIGGYAAYISDVYNEGELVRVIMNDDSGEDWNFKYVSGTPLYTNTPSGLISFSTEDVAAPIAIKNLTAKVKLAAFINKPSELDLTKEVQLDGSTTIELVYL